MPQPTRSSLMIPSFFASSNTPTVSQIIARYLTLLVVILVILATGADILDLIHTGTTINAHEGNAYQERLNSMISYIISDSSSTHEAYIALSSHESLINQVTGSLSYSTTLQFYEPGASSHYSLSQEEQGAYNQAINYREETQINLPGGDMIIFTPFFTSDGGIIIVRTFISVSVIFNEILKIVINDLITGLIVILLSIPVSRKIAERVASPIQAITIDVRRIADGELKHRAETKTGYIETDELAKSVNRMAETIQENLKHIDDSLRHIEVNLHELAVINDKVKNPLQAIVMLADMKDEEHGKQVKMHADEITKAITRLDVRWTDSANVRHFLMAHYDL